MLEPPDLTRRSSSSLNPPSGTSVNPAVEINATRDSRNGLVNGVKGAVSLAAQW